MQEFIHQNKEDNKVEFRKWAKDVDKICVGNVKLNDIDKLQLYNNAVQGLITS